MQSFVKQTSKPPSLPYEKALFSIHLSNLPPACTIRYLEEYLQNIDYIIAIRLIPDNCAEIIIPSPFECFYYLINCMYIHNHYIIKQPSFKAGLKLDNFVTFNEDHSVTLKVKKEYTICLGSIENYFRKKLGNLPFDLECEFDSPSSFFNLIRVNLSEIGVKEGSPETAFSLLIHQIGFVGHFYSIPYAGFNFKTANMYDISCLVMKIQNRIQRRFLNNKKEEEISNDTAEPTCKEGDNCSYFAKLRKSDFSNFFSEEMNNEFIEHSQHLDLEKEEGFSFQNLKKFLFSMLDRKPSFVKTKAKSDSLLQSK